MEREIHWGLLGASAISHRFVHDFAYSHGGKMVAIAARDPERAKKYAQECGIEKGYSYEDLYNDKDIDIVYISTTHNFHFEQTKQCLLHGKSVLCEKSFAMNEQQVKEIIDLTKQTGCFVIEAMWTRFMPGSRLVCDLIKEGKIGEVTSIDAALGFCMPENIDVNSRLVNMDLAGGTLLDIGVYTVEYATMVMNGKEPIKILADGTFFKKTGCDQQTHLTLHYDNGAMASLHMSFVGSLPGSAFICGSKGTIKVEPFQDGRKVILRNADGEQIFNSHNADNGFCYEIDECNRLFKEKKLQSDLMPLTETQMTARIMDEAMKQIGLKYPCV